MNILRNQVGIFILAITLLFVTLIVSILSSVSVNVYETSNNIFSNLGVNTSSSTAFKIDVDDTMETVITGVNFLITLIVVLTIYSSFVSQNTVSSYLLYFIASVFLSSILIYLFHQIYNTFVLTTSTSTIIDMNTFSDFIWVNFDSIILLNVIAFLISFLFRRVRAG